MKNIRTAIAQVRTTIMTLRTLNPRSARRLLRVLDKKPVIEIFQAGSATDRPQVFVGFTSKGGMTSAMVQADDDAGNARCTSYAGTLSNITGLAVVDRRETRTNEAGRYGNGFVAVPRDVAEPEEVEPTRSTFRPFRILGGLTPAI